MHIELQQAMQHLVAEQSLNLKEVSRFTPVDFRLGIQYLVAQDKPDLAQALAEAGHLWPLGHYPRRLAACRRNFARSGFCATRSCAAHDLPDVGARFGMQPRCR